MAHEGDLVASGFDGERFLAGWWR